MRWLTTYFSGPQSPRRCAVIGISCQFLALLRLLGEYYRLRYSLGSDFTIAAAEPYHIGATITAVLSWLAVMLFFSGRYKLVTMTSVFNIAVLIAYKAFTM